MANARLLALPAAALAVLYAACNRNVASTPGLGLHRDGDFCFVDLDCASRNCVGAVGADGMLGTCQAPPADAGVEIDGVCAGGQPCIAGAACEDGICVATAALCGMEGDACSQDSECCSGKCGSDGTCTSQCTGQGESCSGGDCCPGSYCDVDDTQMCYPCGGAGDRIDADCVTNDDCCGLSCAGGVCFSI
jgi:hypothetical protein